MYTYIHLRRFYYFRVKGVVVLLLHFTKNAVGWNNYRGISLIDEDVYSNCCADTVVQFQCQLDRTETLSSGLDLEINIEKTKIFVFRTGGSLKQSER